MLGRASTSAEERVKFVIAAASSSGHEWSYDCFQNLGTSRVSFDPCLAWRDALWDRFRVGEPLRHRPPHPARKLGHPLTRNAVHALTPPVGQRRLITRVKVKFTSPFVNGWPLLLGWHDLPLRSFAARVEIHFAVLVHEDSCSRAVLEGDEKRQRPDAPFLRNHRSQLMQLAGDDGWKQVALIDAPVVHLNVVFDELVGATDARPFKVKPVPIRRHDVVDSPVQLFERRLHSL